MSKEKILQIFQNLPEAEINRPIVSIEGKIYTWKQCIDIIKEDENSSLAKKIIEKIGEIIA